MYYNYLDATTLERGIEDYRKYNECLENAMALTLSGGIQTPSESALNILLSNYIEDMDKANNWFKRVGITVTLNNR